MDLDSVARLAWLATLLALPFAFLDWLISGTTFAQFANDIFWGIGVLFVMLSAIMLVSPRR